VRYLLDTNHWIAFLKGFDKPLGVRIERTASDQVVTCSIVRAELLHGAEKYGNREARVQLIDQTLGPYKSFAFDDAAAAKYAGIRHSLEVVGKPIGPYDLQIAAICLANELVLVTGNTREFTRVDGLAIEDWGSSA